MRFSWKKLFGHLKTITAHRHMVIRHCKAAGILWQGLWHDMTKYTPAELISGARYYTDGKKSPNEAEREEYGYSLAWMHHQGRNRHHYEYWRDYNPKEKRYMPVPMPTRFFKELLCDRIAASKIYQKEKYTSAHPLEYFLNGMAPTQMHPKTAAMTEYYLTMLKDQGEAAMFDALKKLKD